MFGVRAALLLLASIALRSVVATDELSSADASHTRPHPTHTRPRHTTSGSPSVTGTSSNSQTGSASPSHTGSPVPACESCTSLVQPLQCYGDATSGAASDRHSGGLPYTLTQARANQYGECWYGCPLRVDDFIVEFDLAVSDLLSTDHGATSGIAVVFYDRAHLDGAGGPTDGNPFTPSALPSPVSGASASAPIVAPPQGHRGQWEMRLYANTNGLSLWPTYGLSTGDGTVTSPLAAQHHPYGNSASFHVMMHYSNAELLVQWSEVDSHGHAVSKDARWFTTSITSECGCGDGEDDPRDFTPAGDACDSSLGWCPSPSAKPRAICTRGCLAGFGLRGWTERLHYVKQSITSLTFSMGDHDLMAEAAAEASLPATPTTTGTPAPSKRKAPGKQQRRA